MRRDGTGGGPRELGDPGAPGAWRWWAALVVPLWAVLAVCAYFEPMIRDGWYNLAWFRDEIHGVSDVLRYAHHSYLHENPRLGQIATLLAYAPGPYHAILTPLMELATLALLTAMAIGRWPSVRRSGDALAGLLVIGLIAACMPQVGPMLCYRPFIWNYLFGLGLNLWWLLPYRLAVTDPRPERWWRVPGMFVVGAAAGLCNEHTGVAFVGMAALATWVIARRGELRLWMLTGIAGLVTGYAVLLTAPAQHERYQGLARHAGVLGRIAERGALGNLGVLGWLIVALLPALPLVVIGVMARRRRVRAESRVEPPAPDRGSLAVLAIGGLVCTLTLLASPKLGPRLYSASVALIIAALVGWLMAPPVPGWARRWYAILAGGALAYVAIRLVLVTWIVAPLAADRLDRLVHAPPGAVVTVPRLPSTINRYFFGDDFRGKALRDLLAHYFKLAEIRLEPGPGDRSDSSEPSE